MRIGQTVVVFLFSKFGNAIVSFLATIYFTRLLGAEVYGFYALALALVSWFGLIKSVGFTKAVVKRMSEDEEEADEYLAAGTLIKFSLVIIIVFGIIVLQQQINAYVGEEVAELIILVLITNVMWNVVSSGLKGTHRVHIYAPLSTAKQFVRSAIMVLLVFIGWELTGMLFGYALGTVLVAIVGFFIVRPNIVIPSREHFTSLVEFAKYSWLGNMRSKTLSDVDVLVLGAFVSASLTGIYAVTYSLSKILDAFARGITTTILPEISNISADGNYKQVSTLTESALQYAGLLIIPGVVGAAIIGDRLLRIYGPEFEQGSTILVIIVIGVLFFTYAKQLSTVLNGIDRPDLSFRANAVFITFNISLNIILVWILGWIGAAIATVSSATLFFVITYYYLNNIISISIPYNKIVKEWVAAIVMGVCVYLVRQIGEQHWISTQNEVFVICLIIFGATVYFISFALISAEFREVVQNNLPGSVPLLSK